MRDLGARLRALTPRQILAIGWLGIMLYAYPGFMSFDSVRQLQQSRWGIYTDGHPPAMAFLWRLTELFVTGPAGMLVIQTACFLAGAYLVFGRVMSRRGAAIAASALLWFPPIAGVMGVIWKDSQMAAFLMLGFGLLLQDQRRLRLLGLAALVVATAMRHNALVITGPLIVVCFVWDPAHRFVMRHAIAIAAWIAVTLTAQVMSSALTDHQQHLWHTSLALCDIAATLRYTEPTIPDDELRTELAGLRLKPAKELHAFARRELSDTDYITNLWRTTYEMFEIPETQEERDAVTRAWKRVVLAHPGPYLTYRRHVFELLIGLGGGEAMSPVYNWFVDVQRPDLAAVDIDHDAGPARVQDLLRRAIHVVGATPLFSIALYALLTLGAVPFSFRDRRVLALIASAITSEAVLFLISPTTDWRYSFWMVVAVVVAIVLVVAERIRARAAA